MLLRLGMHLKKKEIKYYHDLYLICNVLLLADGLVKFRNNNLKLWILSELLFECTSFLLGSHA